MERDHGPRAPAHDRGRLPDPLPEQRGGVVDVLAEPARPRRDRPGVAPPVVGHHTVRGDEALGTLREELCVRAGAMNQNDRRPVASLLDVQLAIVQGERLRLERHSG